MLIMIYFQAKNIAMVACKVNIATVIIANVSMAMDHLVMVIVTNAI